MGDAMGKKTRVKLFRLSFSTGRSSRKDWRFRLALLAEGDARVPGTYVSSVYDPCHNT